MQECCHGLNSAAVVLREGFHGLTSAVGVLREGCHGLNSAAGVLREGLIPGHLRKGVGFRDLVTAARGGWGAPDLLRNSFAEASMRKIAPQD